ncbi:MAG: hypothetical protein HC906_06625 [Bacteroidales bacterium]|nr:hypothetical protein [Bacteroidales bacterium]
MGASGEVQSTGKTYASIIIGSNVIIMLLFVNNAIFRSAGDAMISMIVLIIANLLNIILDPCLILVWDHSLKWGVTGAALATCIGRGTGVLIQFYFFFRKNRKIYHYP